MPTPMRRMPTRVATDPKHAPAFMAHAMLAFNEQIERIGEVAAVMAVGMLLWAVEWRLALVGLRGRAAARDPAGLGRASACIGS